MKCYGQIIWETESMANPYPDDYQTWDTIESAKRELQKCDNHRWLDASEGVTLLLWMEKPDNHLFPCDMSHNFPDRVYILGPRGGVKREG